MATKVNASINPPENENFDDTPLTPEEERDEVLFNEDALLRALTAKDHHEHHTKTIKVVFGKTPFQFRIRPLSEKEWDRCRERNTRYSKNRRLGGMRLPESTDTTGYHSDLIYTATVDEDREKLWDNKRLWKAVNAVTGTDMVDRLIPYAGIKQQIVDQIENISGFDHDTEANYEDMVKN